MMYGVGYLGKGPYSSRDISYALWSDMFSRVYSKRYPSYKDCIISKAWYNYQHFSIDIVKMPNYDTKGFDLDKDLIKLGNKLYAVKYCSFVPHAVNALLKPTKNRNGLPAGVFKANIKNGKSLGFRSHISIEGKIKYLGFSMDIHEIHQVYLEAKVKYIHNTAKIYKDDIDRRVYTTLMSITPNILKEIQHA